MFSLFDLGSNAAKAINAAKKAVNENPDIDLASLSGVCLKEVKDWHPEVKGQKVLTAGVRASLSRGLAGLAYNIVTAERGLKCL